MNENNFLEIIQRLTKIETKLDDIGKLRNDVDEIKVSIAKLFQKDIQQQAEINELKESHKWRYRTLIGAVITSIVALAFTLIKINIGM